MEQALTLWFIFEAVCVLHWHFFFFIFRTMRLCCWSFWEHLYLGTIATIMTYILHINQDCFVIILRNTSNSYHSKPFLVNRNKMSIKQSAVNFPLSIVIHDSYQQYTWYRCGCNTSVWYCMSYKFMIICVNMIGKVCVHWSITQETYNIRLCYMSWQLIFVIIYR